MIHLVQPPSHNDRITGGYRYNAEIARRLESTGIGAITEATPETLEQIEFDRGDVLVLDSLYISLADPPTWMSAGVRTVLLLHYLPSLDPTATEEDCARLAERERLWLGAAERVLTTSVPLAEEVRDRTGRFVPSATPGVSPCFRRHRPGAEVETGEALRVVSVGTIVRSKGQHEIVQALARRAREGAALQLTLIGDDQHDPAYVEEVRAAAEGLELAITGCLAPEAVAEHLRRAQLFVSGSVFESYGMSVAEAIATGVPVVAYRTGEVHRWVHESVNGHLVEAGDSDVFARVISELVGDRARLESLRDSDHTIFFPSWEYTFERFLRAVRSDDMEVGTTSEVTLYSECLLPTRLGLFEVEVYRLVGGEEAILIYMGALDDEEPPFVRVHSECFTGEILGSLKCDCRLQLDLALEEIAKRERGAVVYLRQEGRGIGLGNKIRAYAEQQKGADTIQANERLGFPADLRDFRVAALMLAAKGVTSLVLNTNNPNKAASLEANGLNIARVIPSSADPNPHNLGYLATKYHSMGHAGLERALHRIGALPSDARGSDVGNGKPGQRKPLLIFDLDGVVQLGDVIPEEARRLIERLRGEGYGIRFLTNDGINSRQTRLDDLTRLGLEVTLEELYTASYLTARFVRESGAAPVLPLLATPALDEFEGIATEDGTEARTVIVGDYFRHYDYDVLKRAYDALAGGAQLIAMHRKPSWPNGDERVIDIGFWVAGLEYCAGRAATVVGKPSAYSYRTVLADAGYSADEAIMISDELDPDLEGAREAGLRTMRFHPVGLDGMGLTYADLWELLAKC